MKILLKLSVVFLMLGALSGCEWSSGGDSWSDAPDWVNFSGVYRGAGGGLLVTDYTSTSAASTVTGELVGNTDGANTVFSGVLQQKPVLAGSLTIESAQFNLSDNGDGSLSGSGASGTINYGTGAWSIQVSPAPDAGDSITASYQYTPNTGSGTSGIDIYSFTVVHQANNALEITDNNGSVYRGKFGDVSATSTTDEEENVVYEAGSTAIAQFSAEGVSAAGVNVTMTGTMQGVLATTGGVLGERIMVGTWIEDGGRTGDINGEAPPIAVSLDTTSSN